MDSDSSPVVYLKIVTGEGKHIKKRELRMVCMVEDYDGAVAFFRDDLELPITHSWDRGLNDLIAYGKSTEPGQLL